MKKLTLLLSFVIAAATFLFIHKSSLDRRFLRDDEEPFESVTGDKDNPDAAFRFRYAMLAGNQQNIDLLQMRQEAIGYTNQMIKSTRSLNKTSAATWTALGPGNIGGRVRSIVIHPTNSNLMLIGGVSGGVWKSTDGGATWKPKGDSLDFMAISSMVIDPTNSNIVYAGTGEGWGNLDAVYGGGIYKSTNFGDSWTLLASTSGSSASSFRNVMKLAADGSGNIYAATKNYTYKYNHVPGEYTVEGGLFKSTNGGTSWTKISSTDMTTNYFTPTDVIPITTNTIIYAVGKSGTTNGGIYRTTNDGTNWAKIVSNLPTSNYGRIALAQDPSSSNTLYSVFQSYDTTHAGDAGLKGIYKSTDGGVKWTQLTSPPKIVSTGNMSYLKNQGWYDNVIAVDPNNSNNIYVGGVDMMKSTNGGSSWSQVTYWDPYYGSPVVHADHHALVFDKNNTNTFYSGNDGGVYKTTNGGASWTMLNNGLEITQFYSGAVYKSGATYHGGTQDNGHLKYSGSGIIWTTVAGGDGGYSAQDQSNSSVMYEEYVWLEMSKSTDGGVNWSSCINGLTDAKDDNKCLFIAPFAMNPENSSVLVAGSDKVWVTSNSASSWTQSSNVLSSGANVSAVTVVNATANYLGFAGTTDGKIFKCTSLDPASGIDTWTDITPTGNNSGWVRRIVVDQSDKNKIYATYAGYNTSGTLASRHVWYSTNQGTSWTDISGNLPNVPVHTLAKDPSSSTTLYVGTETGVYSSTNGGGTWASFNAGMPLYVPTDELVVQSNTKALFAFTHGRGVFTTSPSTSSSEWTVQSSGITTNLVSVKAANQSIVWTAGVGGKVLVTTNGGSNWNSVGGGAIGTNDIYAIEALDANTAFVTTTPTSSSTFIFRTINGGITWTQVYTQSGGFIDAIKMYNASNGIALGDPVGGKWTILKTTDGGATWARIATEPTQVGTEASWNNSLSTIGTTNIWFGTNSNRIYRSTDGGMTWSSSSVAFQNSINIGFSSAQYGIAGADDGSAARTTDGGITWTPVSVGGSGAVTGLSGVGVDFFASKGGTVYRSTNRGATWTESFTGSIGNLRHLSFVANGSNVLGWTVSNVGNIAAFIGASTVVENKPTDTKILETGDDLIHGFKYYNGFLWASTRTSPARILKINPSTLEYQKIILPTGYNNGEDLVVADGNIYVILSIDPARIIQIEPNTMTWKNFVQFGINELGNGQSLTYSTGILWAGGFDRSVAKIDIRNGSYQIFKYQDLPSNASFHALTSDNDFIWGIVRHYDFSGASYASSVVKIDPTNPSNYISQYVDDPIADDIATVNGSLYCGTEKTPSRMYKFSSNLVPSFVQTNYKDCFGVFYGSSSIWSVHVGSPGQVIKYDFNLYKKEVINLPDGFLDANEIALDPTGNVYTTCWETPAKIVKLNQTTGVDQISGAIPSGYFLSQNYPNPFNPTTVIKYSIPRLSKVTLKIYDILGKEVEKLVDEEKSPGQYEVKFNARRLASGIYLYRLQSGEFSQTKKLLLLK